MDKNDIEFLKALNGTEILLCPYGSVMIKGKSFIYCGESHKIDSSNFELIKDAYYMTEYGTTDFNAIMIKEGF